MSHKNRPAGSLRKPLLPPASPHEDLGVLRVEEGCPDAVAVELAVHDVGDEFLRRQGGGGVVGPRPCEAGRGGLMRPH